MENTNRPETSSVFSAEQLKAVEDELGRLKGADDDVLNALHRDSVARRLRWFNENKETFDFIDGDLLMSAYRLLLKRFGITPEEAPVVKKTDNEIVFHSMNFCPTLEVCRTLGLDTRHVCKCINERSTDLLIKQLDPRLTFSRNYEKLRPYAGYCEEMIALVDITKLT